jgi:hypothetical protein
MVGRRGVDGKDIIGHAGARAAGPKPRLNFLVPWSPRDRLKGCGFRWSPTQGAWVRQRNNAAWAAARYAMEVK